MSALLTQESKHWGQRQWKKSILAVNNKSRPKYAALGKQTFSYNTQKGRGNVKRYYEVPEDLFEDQDTLLAWARESIVIAEKNPKIK